MEQQQPRKAEEHAIAAQVHAEQLIKQIAILKRLPENFRDIDVGSNKWEAFANIMGVNKRLEMEQWASGPVLSLRKLKRMERVYFNDAAKILEIEYSWTGWENFSRLIEMAERDRFSWIYTPTWPDHIATGLSWLMSHCKMNVRFKSQIKNDRGIALGD